MNRRFMSLTYFVLSQTALIFYHVVFCLSRTFLTFFKFVFLDFFCFRSNFDILSLLFSDVKDFFQLFSKLFSVLTAFPDATLTSYHCFLYLSTSFFIFSHFFIVSGLQFRRPLSHALPFLAGSDVYNAGFCPVILVFGRLHLFIFGFSSCLFSFSMGSNGRC